jgi:glycosyltransferase involved in cell wall biosynthesis
MKGGLSLVVLSRDEARKLDRCLGSLRHVCEEIVVIDTGSVDDSLDVIKKHGATLYQMEWPNNWSIALNELISKVKTDWTLRLDQDEWFDDDQARALKDLTRHEKVAGYYILRRDLIEDGSDRYDEINVLRLWRTHEKIRFERAMHETMHHADFYEAWPGKVLLRSDVWFWHDGHVNGMRHRAARNIAYLRKDLEEHPGDLITRSYLATTLHGSGDPEGKPMLAELVDDILKPGAPERPPNQVGLAIAMHMELITAEEAMTPRTELLIKKTLEWYPTNPVHLFYIAVLERKRGNLERALQVFLKVEKLAESGDYDRGMSIPLEFLGERLWKGMGYVATKLGREDIVRRCQMKLAASR